jgi:hypothetical protein
LVTVRYDLEDTGGKLDTVLNGGVEGVHHGRGAVPLPVQLVHLLSAQQTFTSGDIYLCGVLSVVIFTSGDIHQW